MILQEIGIDRFINNITKYSTVIKLLYDAISNEIHRIVVRLDSKLVVIHLTNVYSIRSPTMIHMFLRVHFLERHFNYSQYQHIPRSLNTLTNALENHVLGRHLRHM